MPAELGDILGRAMALEITDSTRTQHMPPGAGWRMICAEFGGRKVQIARS